MTSPSANSLNKISTIARNTFREAIRDKILYNLVLFVLLISAAAIFLGQLTAGQEIRTITDLGLSAMLIFGAFIAIFVGVGLVSKEIEKRTVYAIFSKPVTRAEFIIGKFLGLCLTLLVNLAVMGVGVSLALVYAGGQQNLWSVWAAIFLIFWQLVILTAIATLFSSFSSPALSALLAFLIFIIGNFSASLREFAQSFGSEASKYFFDFLYYFLPNFSYFGFITNAAHGDAPVLNHLSGAALYAVIYSVIVITGAIQIFSRRNFK